MTDQADPQAEIAALRAKIERVERRILRLRARHDNLAVHGSAGARSVLAEAIGGLLDDLDDGTCQCRPLNGVGRLISPYGLACEHGTVTSAARSRCPSSPATSARRARPPRPPTSSRGRAGRTVPRLRRPGLPPDHLTPRAGSGRTASASLPVMTDQTPRIFTATVEAQYADDMRTTRDLTDAAIRDGFIMPIDDQRIAEERAKGATTRRGWEEEAIKSAVSRVLLKARDASVQTFGDEDGRYYIATGDLDGAALTITVRDLVATATLTLPQGPAAEQTR